MSTYDPALELPAGVTEDGEFTRTGVIVAFIAGVWALLTGPHMAVLGVLLSCEGLDRVATDRQSARKLLLWSWLAFGLAPLGTALIVAPIALLRS
jgi:hypothetical protein